MDIRNAKEGDRVQIPLNCEVRKVASKSGRVLRYTASNEMVDRYKTIIKVDGWETKAWLANPTIFWGHNSSEPPIGQGVRLAREMHTRADGRQEKRLAVDIDYIPREVYPFADMIYKMAERGDLRAVSVGFDIIEKRAPTEEEEREYGLEKDHGVMVIARQELFEISKVGVPGNTESLIDTLATFVPAVRQMKPADVSEKWLTDQLEAIRKNLLTGEAGANYRALANHWGQQERGMIVHEEAIDIDRPLTERRMREILRDIMGPAEKRFADCFRGLAKRSEVVNLGLSLEDLGQEVEELKRSRQQSAPVTKKAADPYDKVLREIASNLKG